MGRPVIFSSCFILFYLFLSVTVSAVSDEGEIADYLAVKAIPAENAGDIDELIIHSGKRRLVLLGESTHGTSEFYRWRAEITKRLISEAGFSFIAVEGDWASIYRLNEYVMGMPGAPSSALRVLRRFDRWPEWMWGNEEIAELAEWMREYNMNLPDDRKVGFYGMDVYGQWDAMDDLLDFTRQYMPDYHRRIGRYLQCFAGFDRDEWAYARAVAGRKHISCENELQNVVDILLELKDEFEGPEKRRYFRAKQNAFVIRNAEDFFRLAMADNTASWNSRATHMWETVKRLLDKHGNDSRAVVWAHNTHVGDANATAMRFSGMVNIGMMSRNELGPEEVFITGFGTNTGRVNAGSSWGSAMHLMHIPEGVPGSYENIFSQIEHSQFFLIFDQADRDHPLLNEYRGHRAIGVVYNPRQEAGNYVPTILPRRYDAFFFIRETGPLVPVR